MGEGRSESVQRWYLACGDEVPVSVLYGCLCYSFMSEGRMDGELWQVQRWGAGRVAGEEVRQVVPPLISGPAGPWCTRPFGVAFDPLKGALGCETPDTVLDKVVARVGGLRRRTWRWSILRTSPWQSERTVPERWRCEMIWRPPVMSRSSMRVGSSPSAAKRSAMMGRRAHSPSDAIRTRQPPPAMTIPREEVLVVMS